MKKANVKGAEWKDVNVSEAVRAGFALLILMLQDVRLRSFPMCLAILWLPLN